MFIEKKCIDKLPNAYCDFGYSDRLSKNWWTL